VLAGCFANPDALLPELGLGTAEEDVLLQAAPPLSSSPLPSPPLPSPPLPHPPLPHPSLADPPLRTLPSPPPFYAAWNLTPLCRTQAWQMHMMLIDDAARYRRWYIFLSTVSIVLAFAGRQSKALALLLASTVQ
jgi:hypothetical protein